MSESNPTTQKAAKEMIQNDVDEIKRKIATEGAYHVVVEGGYHQQKLSDDDADLLTTMLVDHGLNGLITLANEYDRKEGRKNIAQITPLVNMNSSSLEELVNRLNDGNMYPGFYLDYEPNQKTYVLYEEGYEN